MKLIDTIKLMDSPKYQERFKAEYYQTIIRYGNLFIHSRIESRNREKQTRGGK